MFGNADAGEEQMVEMCHVYAIGPDEIWLEAIRNYQNEQIDNKTVIKGDKYEDILNIMTDENYDALLLLDATGQVDIKDTVFNMRRRGWKQVIIVSCNPSASQTYAVLHEAKGSDIWRKSYCREIIHDYFVECLSDICNKPIKSR